MMSRREVAALVLSAGALVGIATHEGFRATAYDDGVGVQTVGYGATRRPDGTPVRAGDITTPPRALLRLAADADADQVAMRVCVTAPLHQYEWDAYVSLTYNIGAGAFCASTLVRRLNARDYAAACAEISRWNRAGGRVLPGLVKRRAEERARCEGADA